MSLVLTVDGDRWRAHLREVGDATPGLTPVVKGTGYGFGLGRLARRTQWLHERGRDGGWTVDTLAVGTYEELPEVAGRYDGSLLVLTPWRPWLDGAGRLVASRSRPGPRPVPPRRRL